MSAREGDLIETKAGLIFDVKGLVHPPDRVVAFIRYFPDEGGKRARRGTAFGKVYSLSERYALLRERFPKYLVYDPVLDETLCEVPVDEIVKWHDPAERLQQLRQERRLDALESKAVQLAELLKDNAGIPWRAIGLSGSILTGLHTHDSDIDPIVYGSGNCRKAYSAMQTLLDDEHSLFKRCGREDLKALFEFRSKDTEMSFEDFVRTDSRKVMQGKFMGTEYFMRFVKDWGEVGEHYGDVRYRNVGYAKIQATVTDGSESIFTPCIYEVGNVRLLEGRMSEPIGRVASFRGRFCEHARSGEIIVAQGKVEQVIEKEGAEYHRMLIGGRPSDYLAMLS